MYSTSGVVFLELSVNESKYFLCFLLSVDNVYVLTMTKVVVEYSVTIVLLYTEFQSFC